MKTARVSSHFIQEPAIKIIFPQSKTSKAKQDTVRTITITKNGEIYFMDKQVDLENLPIAIQENRNNTEKDFLLIKSDRDDNKDTATGAPLEI